MKLIKEIKSKEGVVHFKRWRLFKTPWFEVYIHGIYKEDQDEHLHNHPWNIWTVILRGSYIEEVLSKDGKSSKHNIRTFGVMAYRNADRFHKIKELITKKVYTLAIVGRRKEREWGYHTDKGFVDHITYRKNKNRI
ncbi:MAG: hypothetical protein AABY15_00430 [Nanoarchaeota archaeon]